VSFFTDLLKIPEFNSENLLSLNENLLTTMKDVFEKRGKNDADMETLKTNLEKNIKMIYLDKSSYPPELFERIKKYFSDVLISDDYKKMGSYNKEQLFNDLGIEDYKIEIYG
jgi:hypothetical protein